MKTMLQVIKRSFCNPFPPAPMLVKDKQNFPHNHSDFKDLLISAEKSSNIPRQHLERDYWQTHCLWALNECGLNMELKGGVSLSKGFNLLPRSSEDVDISINSIVKKKGNNLIQKPFYPYTSISTDEKKIFFQKIEMLMHNNIPGIIDIHLGEKDDIFFDDQYQNGVFFLKYDSLFPDSYGALDKNSLFPYIVIEINSLNSSLRPNIMRSKIMRNQIIQYRTINSFLEQYIPEEKKKDDSIFWQRIENVNCIHPAVTILQKIFDCLIHRYKRPIELGIDEEYYTGALFDSRNVRHFEDY